MDRGAWQVTVQGVPKESDTTEQLRMHTRMCNLQSSLYDSIHLHYYHHHNLNNNFFIIAIVIGIITYNNVIVLVRLFVSDSL